MVSHTAVNALTKYYLKENKMIRPIITQKGRNLVKQHPEWLEATPNIPGSPPVRHLLLTDLVDNPEFDLEPGGELDQCYSLPSIGRMLGKLEEEGLIIRT